MCHTIPLPATGAHTSSFNKPPIEDDQLAVETHRIHYSLKTTQAPL